MKKLTNVSLKVWFATIIVIIISLIVLFAILKSNVESKISANIQVIGYSKQSALIDADAAYKLKVGNSITLNVNNHTHFGTIKSITFDETKQKFLVEFSGLDLALLPGSNLSATIIYDTHKVIDSILGSV